MWNIWSQTRTDTIRTTLLDRSDWTWNESTTEITHRYWIKWKFGRWLLQLALKSPGEWLHIRKKGNLCLRFWKHDDPGRDWRLCGIVFFLINDRTMPPKKSSTATKTHWKLLRNAEIRLRRKSWQLLSMYMLLCVEIVVGSRTMEPVITFFVWTQNLGL